MKSDGAPFQFSLRTLLIVTTFCAACLAVAAQAPMPLRIVGAALPACVCGFAMGFLSDSLARSASTSVWLLAMFLGLMGAIVAFCGFVAMVFGVVLILFQGR